METESLLKKKKKSWVLATILDSVVSSIWLNFFRIFWLKGWLLRDMTQYAREI